MPDNKLRSYPRPRIVVSRCLGFEECRWNGQVTPSEAVDSMHGYVDYHTICPEVEIGMGVPRLPIRIVRLNDDDHLIQYESGHDFTQAMQWCAKRTLDNIGEVDGFLLKSRSPSCGIKDVKLYAELGKAAPLREKTSGMFAREVLLRFPLTPTEDEGRLTNFKLREHYLMRIFTLADFRATRAAGRMGDLVAFHSRHKYLFMACDQSTLSEAGAVVANHEHLPIEKVFAAYEPMLRRILANPPDAGRNANVLLHILGYFKEKINAAEKEYFLGELQRYRNDALPLSAVTAILRGWVARFDMDYLKQQTYFAPFPPELVDLGDSGKGRNLR